MSQGFPQLPPWKSRRASLAVCSCCWALQFSTFLKGYRRDHCRRKKSTLLCCFLPSKRGVANITFL